MKKIICITVALTMLTLFACKKIKNESMTVVKDCTGTYLRFHGKDYHVCNVDKVSSFANGVKVTATFKKIKECNDPSTHNNVCHMYHESEGWINVEEIK